ncbi:uncharacterized protein LOC110734929 [Chenopodium quinoa]|uniref:uncharacterized protein LOC110734929 n=1 Tax=Chenopodium quinoa TaxID=63459 RepID=UPI000B774DE9|nr:uncharacterized protein LOC110734929 [Chenopodium quinoa]
MSRRQGTCYLVDAGYTNEEGFLAPYRGQRYHLKEWKEGYQPTTPEENCSFYGIETHADIISACCLLHNLIRREMRFDPLELLLDTEFGRQFMDDGDDDYFNVLETSNAWTI